MLKKIRKKFEISFRKISQNLINNIDLRNEKLFLLNLIISKTLQEM